MHEEEDTKLFCSTSFVHIGATRNCIVQPQWVKIVLCTYFHVATFNMTYLMHLVNEERKKERKGKGKKSKKKCNEIRLKEQFTAKSEALLINPVTTG